MRKITFTPACSLSLVSLLILATFLLKACTSSHSNRSLAGGNAATEDVEIISTDARLMELLGSRLETHEVYPGILCRAHQKTGDVSCNQCFKIAFGSDDKNVHYFSKVWDTPFRSSDVANCDTIKDWTKNFMDMDACVGDTLDGLNGTKYWSIIEPDLFTKNNLRQFRKIDLESKLAIINRCYQKPEQIPISQIEYYKNNGNLVITLNFGTVHNKYYLNLNTPSIKNSLESQKPQHQKKKKWF